MDDLVKQYLAYRLCENGVGSRGIEKLGQKVLAQISTSGDKLPLQQLLLNECGSADWNEFLHFSDNLRTSGTIVKTLWEGEYPDKLKRIKNPPTLLFCRGEVSLLNRRMVAIVGTRGMSTYGRRVLQSWLDITTDTVIVSGLADGVDSLVHDMAMRSGNKTVAVVAGGVDQGFPLCNEARYEQIVKSGLVIAEFPPGRAATRGMYPMRNRIIAGLADVVIIIESRKKGGSLITANYAFQFGRSVYAVPGDVFCATSVGCNELLKKGAIPVLTRNDFLQIIGGMGRGIVGSDKQVKTGVSWLDSFFESFGNSGFVLADIVEHTNGSSGSVDIAEIHVTLTKLELDGILKLVDGKFSLVV